MSALRTSAPMVDREPNALKPGDGFPRILICDAWIPTYDRDAGSLRMSWILRLLRSLGCAVTFFPEDRVAREPYRSELEIMGIEVICTGSSFGEMARTRMGQYDLVILSRLGVAAALVEDTRRYFPKAIVVYDTVDLQFLREARRRAARGIPWFLAATRNRKQELEELSVIKRCDLTIAVTDVEATIIRKRLPHVPLAVIPTVHCLDPLPGKPFHERSGLLFIGGFRHSPNVDAVLHFVKHIYPLISREVEARVTVLGSEPPLTIRALSTEQICVTGYVGDVGPYFRTAKVFVSPLRYGAGMKGKNGQAMAFGLPMVTTTVGAEGMHLIDGRHALIRDRAKTFAAAVVKLYSSEALWNGVSSNARQVLSERWTPEATRHRLSELLAKLQLVS